MRIEKSADPRFKDFFRLAAEGVADGVRHFTEYGHNESFGTSEITLATLGGLYNWLESEQKLQVVSDDASDDLTGTGAQKVKIEGLDGNFSMIEEIVEMNGTSTVQTSNSFFRINEFYVEQAGTDHQNNGLILLQTTTPTDLKEIVVGDGTAHVPVYTIPDICCGFLIAWHASELSNKGVKFELWIRENPRQIWKMLRLNYALGTEFERLIHFPLSLPGKTDVEIRAVGLQSGSRATGGFSGYYYLNGAGRFY